MSFADWIAVPANWVFTIVQTKADKPLNVKVVKDRLALAGDEKVKGKSGKEHELFLVKGELDSLGALLLKANQQFDELLGSKGVNHTFRVTEGNHSWPVWRRYLAEFAPLLFTQSAAQSANAFQLQ